jgi:hypothetical protein
MLGPATSGKNETGRVSHSVVGLRGCSMYYSILCGECGSAVGRLYAVAAAEAAYLLEGFSFDANAISRCASLTVSTAQIS